MTDHAGRMDEIYGAQRHIYDLTRKFYLLGRDRLIGALDPPDGGSVLEIGCGTGRNLILAARRWPRARCYGLDISAVMLTTARDKIARAGLEGRVTVAEADAASFDPRALFGVERFDRVFLSYTLSMIPPWQRAVAQAGAVVAPGGRIDIVDFGQQQGLPSWWRSLLFAWLARFDVTPRQELPAVAAAVARDGGWAFDVRDTHRGYAQSVRISRPLG